MLSRILQKQYRTAYLTDNNLLISEFSKEYPEVNVLIGKHHYDCNQGLDELCHISSLQPNNCSDCTYLKAVHRAKRESTCYNPLSYYYMTQRPGWIPPEVLVIDEAHTFVDAVLSLVSVRLPKSIYKYPITQNPLELLDWINNTIQKIERVLVINKSSGKLYSKMYGKLIHVRDILANQQNKYTWEEEEDQDKKLGLNITPVNVPHSFLESLMAAKKVIIMSGTLTKFHIQEIFGKRPYEYIEIDNPTPVENRPILYKPYPLNVNRNTDLNVFANWLKDILKPYPNKATIVHVTYEWGKQLKKLFPGSMNNTPENKQSALKRFKKRGGLWFAAGCDKGIDLPDDMCRLNITLRLPRANLQNDRVRKRISLPEGERWFDLETLNKTQQQIGRSTRHIKDYSINIIADPQFKALVTKYRDELPKSFLKGIQW